MLLPGLDYSFKSLSMKMKHLPKITLLLLLLATSAGNLSAQGTTLWAIYPFGDSIWGVDTSNFAVQYANALTGSGTSNPTSGNGLAVHPCTGEMYTIVKYNGVTSRTLGTIDPYTGIVDSIGSTGDKVANICFHEDGRLFGVTGNGATVSETLYEIDIATGAMTLVTALGAGSDGECIQYCPDNGMLYHWSGRNGANGIMEKVDPNTGNITSITRTGYDYDEVFGSVYIGNGEFMLTNLDQEVIIVDTAGFATLQSGLSTHEYYRGTAFLLDVFDYTIEDTICQNTPLMVTTSGTEFDSVSIAWGDGTDTTISAAGDTLWHGYSSTGNRTVQIIRYKAGCTPDTTDEAVRVQNIPNVGINPGPTAFFCQGDSVLLTASSGGTSQWYMDGSLIAGADTNVYWASVPGSYNMTKTNQNGCTDSATTATDVVPAPGLSPIAPPSFCEGDTAMLSVSPGAVSYQWYLDGNPISGATGNSLSSTAGGSFTVAVDWNSNGCSDSTMMPLMVIMDSLPTANFSQSADTIWVGQSVNFTNGSSNGNDNFWDFGDTNTDTTVSPSHTYGSTGSYTVTLTVSDSCGSDQATSTVVVVDSPVGINPMTEILAGMTAFPNPFEDQATIRVELTSAIQGRIALFDMMGREVQVIGEGNFAAGVHNFRVQAAGLPAGMYLCRFATDLGTGVLRLEIAR